MSVRNSQMTSRAGATGISHQPGSRGKGKQYNSHAENFIPLPAGSISSPVSALKSLNLTQAVLDCIALLAWIFLLGILIGSVPLAIFLMIFAGF